MDLGLGNTLLAGDPRLVDHIVGEVKSQGIFDQFRKECIADVDTKPAYQNLRTRVESSVNSFLSKQTWKADLNKNQLREILRKHIHEAPYLDAGVERIVDQVVNPKVYSVFMPQIEDVVYKFLGLERPKNRPRNGPCGFKDLLPKDLDPVSPESDKNSLRDVSLDSVDANIIDTNLREKENINTGEDNKGENENDKDQVKNGQHSADDDKSMDESSKPLNSVPSNLSVNNCAKLEEKVEEEEEDSPMFEPIDIMNLNESNISNDSHLSGISELTSHRSRSPDFSNEASRDNIDFSNQDSQFSKVSSDSRLSIVTDFGSSNHASTPLSDSLKDDSTKDRNDGKYAKDNFKAVREFETGKTNKDIKSSCESNTKDNATTDSKTIRRSLSSKETSRDGMDSSTKDSRDSKEKTRDSDSSRSKSTKERESKDLKREKDVRKKQNNLVGDPKNEKHSKSKSKEKSEVSREVSEKTKEKDASSKLKEDKNKDTDKKDVGKEGKDLKDIYKEKIRELREKKELTEKEKMSKDKDSKASKDTKEKRDSSRDKKDSKDYKSSSSRNHNSNRSDSKTAKSSDRETKGTRNESRDKGKRDDRRSSKDYKSKNSSTGQSDSGDKNDGKRLSKSDKDEKVERSDVKQDSKQKVLSKRDSRGDLNSKNSDGKRESKAEVDGKDKKRRDDKKSKIKDDHSSLRKNSDDRRSTDRDGSNGSNGKSSQKNNSSSGTSSTKPTSTNLSKESTTTSNSSSETSDSIEEKQIEKLRVSMSDEKDSESIALEDNSLDREPNVKRLDLGQNEIILPIKKRPLHGETETIPKKPKFAKNFQEAKRLMKVRRRMERENTKRQVDAEPNKDEARNVDVAPKVEKNDVQLVPDDERVQIVEFRDEEYDEPYPEIKSDFTIAERSQIILGGESIFSSGIVGNQFNVKSSLSEMELSIRQSLNEMISDQKVKDTNDVPKNLQNSLFSESKNDVDHNEERSSSISTQANNSSSNHENSLLTKDIKTSNFNTEYEKSPVTPTHDMENENECNMAENCTKDEKSSNRYMESPKESGSSLEPAVSHTSTLTSFAESIRGEKINGSIGLSISTTMMMGPTDPENSQRIKENTILEKELQDPAPTHSRNTSSLVENDLAWSDDEPPCLYFIEDTERLEKFKKFMKLLELEESLSDEHLAEMSNDEIASSVSETMAPPKPKRKYSTSPLTDILLNNTNNNNESHKIIASDGEDGANSLKRRKTGRPKKPQRTNVGLCNQQNFTNGENFVMPLSPESDVSATSEKTPSNPLKDEKSRPRGSNQRYTSDDLYKPRPLFSSSSRRSRRSNQA